MSHEPNDKPDTGVRTDPTPAEAEAAPAPLPGPADEAPVAGVAEGPGAVARVLSAVPGQYWGIDTSYDHVTLDEARRLFNAGVRVAFQCLWTGIERPDPCVNNLHSYKAAGLITCGYLSVSPGRSGLQHVIEGYDNLPVDIKAPGYLRYVAVDVELPNLSFVEHVLQALGAMQGRGFEPLVYTSYNAWKNLLGDPTPPAGTLLWNAFWDNDADFDFERYPYGHDQFVLVGEQFTGGEDVEGVFADRSLFLAPYFEEPVVPPEPELEYTVRDLSFIVAYLQVCFVQNIIPELSAQDKAILKDYVGGL